MCFLSSDFKLLDESQVLLKVPRKDNIYSVDLKSVVPTGDLTCLIAKAIIDESNTWHRRLGHINFKTMNKLVKGNLVKGTSIKFEGKADVRIFCWDFGWLVKLWRNGPDWLFDIDSLSISMNYVPVVAGNKTNVRFVNVMMLRSDYGDPTIASEQRVDSWIDLCEIRDNTLEIQHIESVKKSIGEREQHKMEYESRVNERQIQTTEEKTDTSNALDALDASSVIIESRSEGMNH
ncbi:ribonuclease H-like domain-containing protein [Tanacetum coccineum]